MCLKKMMCCLLCSTERGADTGPVSAFSLSTPFSLFFHFFSFQSCFLFSPPTLSNTFLLSFIQCSSTDLTPFFVNISFSFSQLHAFFPHFLIIESKIGFSPWPPGGACATVHAPALNSAVLTVLGSHVIRQASLAKPSTDQKC